MTVSRQRIYVAGSTKEIERVQRVRDAVLEAGHVITFDWTGEEGEIRDGSGPNWTSAPDVAHGLATREVEAVRSADHVILLVPNERRGLGCFVEFGVAVGHDIPVWVCFDGADGFRDSVFWHLTDVFTMRDDEALGIIKRHFRV